MESSRTKGTFGARVEEALELAGLSQAELARRIGVNPKTVERYVARDEPPSTKRSDVRKTIQGIADELSVRTDWLLTGEGDMLLSGQDNGEEEEELPAPVEEPGGTEHMVYIPLVSVRANGGEGEEPFEEEISHYIAYDVNQLRRAGIDPRRSIALPVSGSSMEPTLSPGDAIVVEKYAGEPIRDGVIYVFRRSVYGLVIKRVFWTDEGNLELRSDNPDGPTLSIVPGEENEWKVIGRVTRVEKAL